MQKKTFHWKIVYFRAVLMISQLVFIKTTWTFGLKLVSMKLNSAANLSLTHSKIAIIIFLVLGKDFLSIWEVYGLLGDRPQEISFLKKLLLTPLNIHAPHLPKKLTFLERKSCQPRLNSTSNKKIIATKYY